MADITKQVSWDSIAISDIKLIELAEFVVTKASNNYPELNLKIGIWRYNSEHFSTTSFIEFSNELKDIDNLRSVREIECDIYVKNFNLHLDFSTSSYDKALKLRITAEDRSKVNAFIMDISERLFTSKTWNWIVHKMWFYISINLVLGITSSLACINIFHTDKDSYGSVFFVVMVLTTVILISIQTKIEELYPKLVLTSDQRLRRSGRILRQDLKKTGITLFIIFLGYFITRFLNLLKI